MKNTPLSDRQKRQIYDAHCMGQRPEDIAQQFGIARSTTYRVISEQRKLQEGKGKEAEVASRTKTIAGDKTNGRLTTTADMHRFEGTCVVGGKRKSRTFLASGSRHAIGQWEKWCAELRSEQDFMDMVERKPVIDSDEDGIDITPAPVPEIEVTRKDDSQAVCDAPSDPIEEIRPVQVVSIPSDERIREAIHDAREEFDAVTTSHMEATGVPLADTSEPAYLIWAKRPEPRCYGLYLTMEDALREVDKLNDVAKFLGNDGAFEVEEVTWKV